MPSKWEDCRIMSLCSEKIPCMFLHIHDDEIKTIGAFLSHDR